MKKTLLCILFFFLTSTTVEALPLGNPAEPRFLPRGVFFSGFGANYDPCCVWPWGSFRAGFYGDFVFDRKMRVRLSEGDNIHRTKIFTNAAYLVFNIANRLDIFGTLGTSRLKISQIEETWGTSLLPTGESMGFLETNTGFSWSIGARAALFHCCGFTIGAEGQYFEARLKFNRYYSPFFTGNAVYFDDNNTIRYKEIQGGVGLSYTITCRDPWWQIIPYVGTKWSWARLKTHDFSFTVADLEIPTRTLTIFELKEQRTFAYALGITLTAWGNTAFTLEGRWLGETALYFNAQFRF